MCFKISKWLVFGFAFVDNFFILFPVAREYSCVIFFMAYHWHYQLKNVL